MHTWDDCCSGHQFLRSSGHCGQPNRVAKGLRTDIENPTSLLLCAAEEIGEVLAHMAFLPLPLGLDGQLAPGTAITAEGCPPAHQVGKAD